MSSTIYNNNDDDNNNNNDDDDDNNNNNNNNNRIPRRNSRFFTISSLCCELSLTRAPKWPGRNHEQITCKTLSAYHVQHVMLCAMWYEGTSPLLSLTEFKSHLLELCFGGWTINRWKRGGNWSTRRKPLTTSFRKCHIQETEDSNPRRDYACSFARVNLYLCLHICQSESLSVLAHLPEWIWLLHQGCPWLLVLKGPRSPVLQF